MSESQQPQSMLAAILEAMQQLIQNQNPAQTSRSFTLGSTSALLGTFLYAPDKDQTFPSWYGRSKTLLESMSLSELDMTYLLLKALGPQEYVQLKGRTSPKNPEDLSYKELVTLLNDIFGPVKSLFRRRHEILATRLPPGKSAEDIVNLANLKGDGFEFQNLNLDTFKIFLMLLF
ncbi:hypothetical protein FO519_010865, partial [Halicephalobus sp. NKZ332]